MKTSYIYRVNRVVHLVDGDTLHAELDLGFRLTATLPIRLFPWDTPELHAAKASPYEKRQAAKARSLTEAWVERNANEHMWVETQKDPESFGRWLGDLYVESAELATLGEALYAAGLATHWPTRWYEQHDPQRNKP